MYSSVENEQTNKLTNICSRSVQSHCHKGLKWYVLNFFWIFFCIWSIFLPKNLHRKKLMCNFASQIARSPIGNRGRAADILTESVYFAYSWFIGISQILFTVKDVATSRCLIGYDNTLPWKSWGFLRLYHHTAWGFGVALSTVIGNARASMNRKS